jgi:hypothetical protein
MDTTRLKTAVSRNSYFKAAGPVNIKTDEGVLIASTMNPDNGRDNAKDAAELVRRYNAFPGLVEALADCMESLKRLPDTEDAYRVTCIEQARQALEAAKAG